MFKMLFNPKLFLKEGLVMAVPILNFKIIVQFKTFNFSI